MATYYNILSNDDDGSIHTANLEHFDNDGLAPNTIVLREEFDERTEIEREFDAILGGGLDGRVDDVEWAVTITTNEADGRVSTDKLETLLYEWMTYLSLRGYLRGAKCYLERKPTVRHGMPGFFYHIHVMVTVGKDVDSYGMIVPDRFTIPGHWRNPNAYIGYCEKVIFLTSYLKYIKKKPIHSYEF